MSGLHKAGGDEFGGAVAPLVCTEASVRDAANALGADSVRHDERREAGAQGRGAGNAPSADPVRRHCASLEGRHSRWPASLWSHLAARRCALCAVALAFVLLPAPGRAAAVDAWELISPTAFDWRQAGHRQAIAKDLLQRLDLLAGVIPPLSARVQAEVAKDAAALQRPGAALDPRERSRLYMSRRYQHYRLLQLLTETRANLECVLAATHVSEEMRCWSLASVNFGDEAKLDLALSMLRSARLIPKDGAMPVKAQDPAVWYGEYGRGILKHILTPYLAEQAAARLESGRQ